MEAVPISFLESFLERRGAPNNYLKIAYSYIPMLGSAHDESSKRIIFMITVGDELFPLIEGFKYIPQYLLNKVILFITNKTRNNSNKLINFILDSHLVEDKDIHLLICDPLSPSSILQSFERGINEHSLINSISEYDLISNISGGTKTMTYNLWLITSLFNGRSFYLYKESEFSSTYVELPEINVIIKSPLLQMKKGKLLTTRPSTSFKVLSLMIENGIYDFSDLAIMLKLSKSRLSDVLSTMQRKSLVIKENNKFFPTETGKYNYYLSKLIILRGDIYN